MGQAKQRGSFEERRELAQQFMNKLLEQNSPEDIELAQRVSKISGCSLEEALNTLKLIRNQNDEKMAKSGYVRVENTPDGIARFELKSDLKADDN
jgi:hypothetical protein